MKVQGAAELQKYGMSDHLKAQYGDLYMAKPVESGYDVSLKLDLTNATEDTKSMSLFFLCVWEIVFFSACWKMMMNFLCSQHKIFFSSSWSTKCRKVPRDRSLAQEIYHDGSLHPRVQQV